MNAAAIIRTGKMILDAGAWKTGKLPASQFPLSRTAVKLGSAWHWRVARLNLGTKAFRLLVAFRLDKMEFRAFLTEETPQGLVVIARLEDHGTHPGLHCHAECDDDRPRPLGRLTYPGLRRCPGNAKYHRRTGGFTEMTAWQTAIRFFRVIDRQEGTLI